MDQSLRLLFPEKDDKSHFSGHSMTQILLEFPSSMLIQRETGKSSEWHFLNSGDHRRTLSTPMLMDILDIRPQERSRSAPPVMGCYRLPGQTMLTNGRT